MLSLLLLVSMCMVTYGENACEDILPNCQNLADKYCEAPYDKLAADVCAKRCQLCSEESSDRIQKRVHGTPSWIDHCWDSGVNHLQDPFCALLTTPVPTTHSTAVPTTPRTCYYVEYNETDIKATDYARDLLPTNVTFNESVHLYGDSNYCKTVCEESVLNDGYECWGFSYNPLERCHLYYYSKPIYVILIALIGESNNTSLFLKRCNNDPSTPVPTTTMMATTTTVPTSTTNLATLTTLPTTTAVPLSATTLPTTTAVPLSTTILPTITTIPKTTTTLPPITTIPKMTTTLLTITTIPKMTTTLPPITTIPKTTTTIATSTQRYCDYEIYNETAISATDFGLVTQTVNGQNVTVNETVKVAKEEAECKTICEASILNDGYECWAFSYNTIDKCYLYYYSRPITIINIPMIGNKTDTTLYLKRCSDDRARFGGTTVSTAGTLPHGVPYTHSPSFNNNGPGEITVVNGSSYIISGTPTNGSVCVFNNQSYVLGATWNDGGCQVTCECINTTSNIASCTNQCPHYTHYPSNCTLIKTSPADCCYTLNCTDGIDYTNATDQGNCTNNIDTCDYYAKSACSGIYEPWAKANCALRCNLCDDGTRELCYDAYSFCDIYGSTLCTEYFGFARQNCRRFCNLCDS